MRPVLLPSTSYYISIDSQVLREAMLRIEEQFRDLLEDGAQAQGLPPGMYAAGQHLNPYSMNQRGLYGTAAALLVLGRSQPSAERIKLIEGLIHYINERPNVELLLLVEEENRADLQGRLARDVRTSFKVAELLYALAAAPPAVTGREFLLQNLLAQLRAARRPSGGWSVDLDPSRDRDALATACVLRALHAVGIPLNEADIEYVRHDAGDATSIGAYVRCFSVLVLAEISGADVRTVDIWRSLFESLRPELRSRIESNYEFTVSNASHYVRVPWQLYLMAAASICSPKSIVTAPEIRTSLLDCIRAVATSRGYVYPVFGHMKSTRTYSVVMDSLWRIQREFDSSRYLPRFSSAANVVSRVVYSRTLSGVALVGAVSLAGIAVREWVTLNGAPWGALGPELAGGVLLGLITLLLNRVRSRRD